MEYEIGDKVKMNRKSRYFKDMKNNISLAWWFVLEENEPLTIIDVERDKYGIEILKTDCNDLVVANLWVLPYEEDS